MSEMERIYKLDCLFRRFTGGRGQARLGTGRVCLRGSGRSPHSNPQEVIMDILRHGRASKSSVRARSAVPSRKPTAEVRKKPRTTNAAAFSDRSAEP
jgi:hypothetical protein